MREGERSSVTLRCILLGLVLVILNCAWVVQMERVYANPIPTSISLFLNVIFTLVALQGLNVLVRWIAPGAILRQTELLVIVSMVTLGSAMAGLDTLTIIPQVAADPIGFATPENRWASIIWPYLPKWLVVMDLPALRGYYAGNSSLYVASHVAAWAPILGAWTVFVFLMLWVMLCLNVLVRRQWQDHERLTYPLIQLPVEMTRPGGNLYRQKPFLIGAALVGALDLLNGFATWYPSVPMVKVWGPDLVTYAPYKPWNAIWWMPVNYFPFVVGMGFLLPIDLLFSCWFFYLFWKMERVVFSTGGWDTSSKFPYINEQCFGAYASIVLFSLWAGRKTYAGVIRKALGRRSEVDDAEEGLRYRTALFGAIGGTAGLVAFSVAAGLPLALALVFFAAYWMLMLAVARIRAELGPPVHDLHFTGPDHMLPMAFGSMSMSRETMAFFSLSFWYNRAFRSSPMPVITEALGMSHRTGIDQRRMVIALAAAGVVGTVATFWAFLHFAYTLGASAKMRAGSWMGFEGFTRMQGWLNNPEGPNWTGIAAMGVGAILSLGLMIAHTRIPGWPFHAMGFAISGSWSMNLVWFPLLLAWVCKWATIRYAGIRGYRTALSFFFGLIVGEAVVGIGWALLHVFLDVPIYNYFGV